MRILIYGAGVIGCLYAALFSRAGYDVSVYARGRRLAMLRESGLLLRREKKLHRADVRITDTLDADDCYDFIFLTVRENQLEDALRELADNASPTIVTMVNTLDSYSELEKLCGSGRILPAFPGAGGSFNGNVLEASLTPALIQPTTFGEIDGIVSPRAKKLRSILRKSGIPHQIVPDMHIWQLCHLAMVVPIADAYYKAENPEKAGFERSVMNLTARQLRHNFRMLKRIGFALSPAKMNIFRFIPLPVLSLALTFVFQSRFGNVFMYRHSMNAPDEMRRLHELFYDYLTHADKQQGD